MKSGWKTSEFWVTVASIVGLVASSAAASLSPKYAAIGAAISASAYAISRGLAKLFPVVPAAVAPKAPEPPAPGA